MQPKLVNFPQHQATLFLGAVNFVPTTKYTPETSTPSRRWWWFFFGRCSLSSYEQNSTKMVFSDCGWCCFNKEFLRAAFECPWDSRGRTFSPFLKNEKWRRYGQKAESVMSHGVSIFVKPTQKIKKQGGKRFPSQFHRSNFVQNFTKNDISTDIHGLVHNGRFWANFGQILWRVLGDHP